MPRVVKHAWTHRPRALGGTDPIEVAAGLLPFAYVTFAAVDIDDGSEYTMAMPPTKFLGSAEGIYDTLTIWNDEAGETFRVGDGGDEALWAVSALATDPPELYAVDAACLFETGFTGEVTLQIDAGIEPVYAAIGTGYYEKKIVATADGPFIIRLAGTVVLDPPVYDVGVSADPDHALSVKVVQVSGATQQIDRGWMLWAKLSGSSGNPVTNP